MSSKLVGLHSPIWVDPALLEEALRDLSKINARMAVGDKVNALEKIALQVLVANHRVAS